MAQLWKTNEQLVKQLVVEKAKNVELDKEKSNLLDRVMELESVVHRLGDNVASRPPNDGGMDLWSVPESIKPAVDTTTTTTATAQKGQTTEFGSLVNELLEKWHGLELDSKAIIDNAKEQADLDQANEEGYVDLAMNSSMQDLICYTVLELKRCKDAMEELKQKMQKTVIMDNKATPFSIRYNGATKCFVNGRNKLWFIEGLLAYHSQPLAAMFTNEYNGVEMVPLPKDEFQGMEHILKIWIPSPTLTVPVDMEHVFSILPIALKYKMIDVMTSCANVLCDTVVEEFDITKAIIDLLKVGAECHLENIVKKCRVWLQENLTIARIEDTLKIATELTLFDLVKKCEERLIASIGDSDFDMSLKGLCLGIRFNLPELISHSFPLCIWRKDVEELLKSKFTIPKLVDQFLTNAISCMTVPWNVDWRFIFSITNLTNTKTGCIPSIGNGCYSCLNDYNGQNRCHTCSHYFCEKCFCKHSMRKCLQFNCKKRYSRNNGSGDVVLDSECLCCGNYYRENDQDDHMKKCMKLRDAVIESLGKNNLRF